LSSFLRVRVHALVDGPFCCGCSGLMRSIANAEAKPPDRELGEIEQGIGLFAEAYRLARHCRAFCWICVRRPSRVANAPRNAGSLVLLVPAGPNARITVSFAYMMRPFSSAVDLFWSTTSSPLWGSTFRRATRSLITGLKQFAMAGWSTDWLVLAVCPLRPPPCPHQSARQLSESPFPGTPRRPYEATDRTTRPARGRLDLTAARRRTPLPRGTAQSGNALCQL